MTFRRSLIGAGAFIAACALLVGCTSTADTDGAPSESSEPVTLTLWGWERGTDAVVDAFNQSQDRITVKYEEIPSGADAVTKITNASRAGEAPDIFTVEYPVVAELATQGVLQDIDDLAGDDVDAGYSDGVRSLVQFGDATWGVPLGSGALVFYYRADLFEQYGIDVPSTWDELREASATVKAANPDVRLTRSALDVPALLSALSWQAGAPWTSVESEAWKTDIDNVTTREVVDYWQAMADEDLVWTETDSVLGQKAADGTYLALISGPWQAASLANAFPDLSGSWRVAPVPSWDGDAASAMQGGTAFGITKDSAQREAAYEFIHFATQTEEGIAARVDGGASTFLPAATAMVDVAAAAYDTGFYGGQDIYAVATASDAAIVDGWIWSPASSVLFTSITDAVNAWKSSGGTLSDSLPTVQAKVTANLTSRGLDVVD